MRRILVYNRKILKPKNPVFGRCFPIPWDRKSTRSLHVSMEDFGFYHAILLGYPLATMISKL